MMASSTVGIGPLKGLILEDRGIISVEGPDSVGFLNGLVTNAVAQAPPDQAVYAALLTPQGKYLFDFFIIRDGETLLIDADQKRLPDLIKRLSLYKLRAKLAITDRSAEFAVSAFDGPVQGAYRDPRDPHLGWRQAIEKNAPRRDFIAWPRADYRRLLLDRIIPDHERDLVPNETFPMDVQFDSLNGIDFKKGCYVGQELTARMKHRSGPRKALARVRLDGALPEAGTPILAGEKEAGILCSGLDQRALAVLRLDRLDGPLT